jgi:hydroxyethylthiazole kinase-like uncharacterized protein yjeF
MQRAAFGIASRCADLLVDLAGGLYGSTVVVLVGPGSNGGDALFAGAPLSRRGARVIAICTSERHHVEGMRAFLAAGGTVRSADAAIEPHLVIDGILGMGARGPLDAAMADLLRWPDAFTVSIDLPSGVDADTGALAGRHVEADLTLATGVLKAAHLIDPAHDACGVIEVIDLGLEIEAPFITVLQRADVASLLEHHEPGLVDADKYRRGVLALLAGSTTYPGAGLLAATAAINSGAGMIRHLGMSELRLDLPEVVVVDGQVQALAIGPGLTDDARELATALLGRDVPAVVDAGAIAWVDPGRTDTIITPHAGELARLLDVDRSDVERERLRHLRIAVERWGVHVLLKGSTTLIATPDGEVFANPTGSIALATAGSGDVLTGMIGALLARGCAPRDAAAAAAYLHGIAGAQAQSGASGIAEMIPSAIALVRE